MFKLRLLPLQVSIYVFYLILSKFELSTCRGLSLSQSFYCFLLFLASTITRSIDGIGLLLTGGLVYTLSTSILLSNDTWFLDLQFVH